MAGWSKVPLPTPPSDLSIPQAGVWPTAMRKWVQRTFKAREYSCRAGRRAAAAHSRQEHHADDLDHRLGARAAASGSCCYYASCVATSSPTNGPAAAGHGARYRCRRCRDRHRRRHLRRHRRQCAATGQTLAAGHTHFSRGAALAGHRHLACANRGLGKEVLAPTVVPMQPEVLLGHSGESVQLVAASGQRRNQAGWRREQ